MNNKTTLKMAGNAALAAGNAHARSEGRPIIPWNREDLDKAHYTFHQVCKEHNLTPYSW